MTAPFIISCDPAATAAAYRPRGGAAALIYSHDREAILCGGAETGKTLAACWKVHLICSKYPKAQGAIIRKTYKSVHGSCCQTFERVIAGFPVERYGGERVERYKYANGSTVWVGGMDNADKVLSSERDFIYCNQVEEMTLDDWEKLTTRTTGRGAVIPFPQTFGDCNPSGSRHWIRERAKAGKLTLLASVHQDNPTLYDEAGNLTEQGRRTMDTLEGLTGVRRQRLLLGQWATAEGAVYDMFNATVHVCERPAGDFKTWYLAMDEGYVHPAVILLVGEDSDGRWHVAREFYERGRLQSEVVDQARQWFTEFSCRLAAVDAAAAGLIADLKDAGVSAVGVKGRVLDGIQAIQNRLKVAGDGRPRLTVDPACVNMANELESYQWAEGKDAPRKECDDAVDAIRYLHAAIEGGGTGAIGERELAGIRIGRPDVHFQDATVYFNDPPLRL